MNANILLLICGYSENITSEVKTTVATFGAIFSGQIRLIFILSSGHTVKVRHSGQTLQPLNHEGLF